MVGVSGSQLVTCLAWHQWPQKDTSWVALSHYSPDELGSRAAMIHKASDWCRTGIASNLNVHLHQLSFLPADIVVSFSDDPHTVSYLLCNETAFTSDGEAPPPPTVWLQSTVRGRRLKLIMHIIYDSGCLRASVFLVSLWRMYRTESHVPYRHCCHGLSQCCHGP